MAASPLVTDIDFVVPIHIDLGLPLGKVISAVSYKATTKFRAQFKGRSACHRSGFDFYERVLADGATLVAKSAVRLVCQTPWLCLLVSSSLKRSKGMYEH
jgi:hypothetical protein